MGELLQRLLLSQHAAGTIKVVFATATLAAGINMPARSTVISSTSVRRGSDAFATISHNELLQMAGRAGRRGYDDRGEPRLVLQLAPPSAWQQLYAV